MRHYFASCRVMLPDPQEGEEEEELPGLSPADLELAELSDASLFGVLIQLVRALVSCVAGFKILSKRH